MWTMWSVKCLPKPGSARIASRSASARAVSEGVCSKDRGKAVPASVVVVLMRSFSGSWRGRG
jgi:hypothetical protein